MLRIPCTTPGGNVPDNGTLYTGVGVPKIMVARTTCRW